MFEIPIKRGGCIIHLTQVVSPLLTKIPNTCAAAGIRSYKKNPSKPKPFPSKLQDWRREQKMPVNPTWRGVLTDGPDYSYPDGRPVPGLVNQLRRAERQGQLMERIVQLTSEIDLAERLHAERTQKVEQERQQLARSRLRAKATETLELQ